MFARIGQRLLDHSVHGEFGGLRQGSTGGRNRQSTSVPAPEAVDEDVEVIETGLWVSTAASLRSSSIA